ncbi:DUF397 domain-containing protein [Streptomyces sp. NPDC051162]|uniref:DUF397 domain-containing protein n=1 Tax=unclassified Streptomyces TaxID=2593676 RepID=UPI00342EBE84
MTTNACLTALEVAGEASWFKSSYSSQDNGGGCVSIAVLTGRVGVRDSKHANGPAFIVPTGAWSIFITEFRAGRPGLGCA